MSLYGPFETGNTDTTMYGIIDCDNCYVSCERVFRPDLNGRPVVVLSNNDGCVVARSNEAKQLGVKEGLPYFKMLQEFSGQDIAVFSSNYELYGEMTARVVEIIRQEAPRYFRYSIDECFVRLDGMERIDLKQWGERLHKRIRKSVGIPVSVGLAPTKTLAKMASFFAKRYPGYRHCCLIDSDEKRIKALRLYPVEKVWGIGRRYALRLQSMGIHTAYDFASRGGEWVRATFNNVVVYRTWAELNGIDCVADEQMAAKKSICTSRSFNGMISNYDELKTHVSNYAARCAEKLRRQQSVAAIVGVFLNTNFFRDDLPQYSHFEETNLPTATNATITIVKAANAVLQRIYKPGFQYKKAGVIVMGIAPSSPVQLNLFDLDAAQLQRLRTLDAIVDRINRVNGSETVILGAQQYCQKDVTGKATHFTNAIRHDFRSPNPTTRWRDIVVLR